MPRFLALALALLGSTVIAQERPTDEECLAFAEEVESSISEGDPEFLNRSVDVDAMAEDAMRTYDAGADLKKAFRDGLGKAPKFGDTIVAYMKLGGSYTFLRVRDVNGTRRVLFRKILQGGVDFHEFVLSKRVGQVKSVNVLTYSTGEYMSDVLRRGYMVAAAAMAGKGAEDQTLKEWAAAAPILARVHSLSTEGRTQEAWEALEELPPSIGSEKWVMVMKVTTAASLEEKKYLQVMDAMTKLFPGDPSLDLMCIDAYFLQKKYKEASAAIVRLENALGGDSYLGILRARMLWMNEETADAKAVARAALKVEPDLEDGYWLLIEISLKDKAHADTAALLTEIETELGLEIADLAEIPEYSEFVKSEEYREWKKARTE